MKLLSLLETIVVILLCAVFVGIMLALTIPDAWNDLVLDLHWSHVLLWSPRQFFWGGTLCTFLFLIAFPLFLSRCGRGKKR